MVTVYCKTCNNKLGDASLFAVYQQSATAYHFIIKHEKRNEALQNILCTKEPEKEKEKKFKSSDIFCKNQPSCSNKFGGDLYIGPKSEAVYCFKSTSIYITQNGQRFDFGEKVKWATEMNKFTSIELKTIDNFYPNLPNKLKKEAKKEFIETVFMSPQEISTLNIGSLVSDKPRTYQVEMYANAMVNNLICYIPTGGGKTMIAAMLAAAMHKLNPNKKVFFVCDRIPLVFQQASYLRYQTGLSVGEFCGQNKELTASKLDFDVLVFTAEFLINKLFSKTLYLADCSCLIIDEIHHAVQGNHSFKRLIETYYTSIDSKYKPRIMGLTASPSHGKNESAIQAHLEQLCILMEGLVCMPRLHSEDLRQVVNRPHLDIIETDKDPSGDSFVAALNELIQPLLASLKIFDVKLENKHASIAYLKNIIRNILREYNIQLNYTRFTAVKFIEKMIHSLELMSIIGIDSAVRHLRDLVHEDSKSNKKSRVCNLSTFVSTEDFLRRIETIRGAESSKANRLLNVLKNDPNLTENSRTIVFVRTRKTARLLVALLEKDEFIKEFWNPKIFVGHAEGAFDGMDWFEDQEPTIMSFRKGESKLLVSTNVLAEGLDVPICDKIILFDRMWTTTEYVQMRGRARHETSQFIVIGTVGEKEFFNSLMLTEALSAKLIQLMMSAYQSAFFDRNLIQMMNSTIERTFETKDRKPLSLKKLKFSLQIFINDTDESFRNLISKLRTCEGYSQYHIKSDSFLAQELFDRHRKAVNALFELRKNISPLDEVNLKLQTIKYLLRETAPNCAISLIEPKLQDTPTNLHDICEEFTFGNLATPNEFYSSDSFNSTSSKFIMEYNEKCIQLMFFSKSSLHKIEIGFDSIDQIVCIDHSDREFTYIYLPLRRAPIVFGSSDEFAASNLKNIDEKFVNWERTFFENVAMWTIKLKFASKVIYGILDALQHIKGNTILFTQVSNRSSFYSLSSVKRDFTQSEDFDSRYALECFLSQNEHILNGKLNQDFISALNCIEPDIVSIVLERMSLYLAKNRYHNIEPHFGQLISDWQKTAASLKPKKDDSNIVVTRRATITPTRIIYHYPQLDVSNSVTRAFGVHNFLRIRFVDENFKKLNSATNYSSMSKIFEKIRVILKSGLALCGRNYEFVAMSTSQLREHGCWMVSLPQGADAIRRWMGDFSSIRCIGKYVARLGQSFSNSYETFESELYRIEPDVSVGEYCFTDGIGKISRKRAVEIAREYFDMKYASAFQIRYAGFKGVLAVDPSLNEDVLVFRESMMKFESQNRKLNVISVAKEIPCFLNRQVILILSALGISDDVFTHFHDLMLKHISGMLVDDKIAAEQLAIYYRSKFPVASNESKFKYTLEPFFKGMLKEISRRFLVDLVNKTRIFIENGRILMGTIDETGTLKSDEVFIQYSSIIKDSKEPKEASEEVPDKYLIVQGKVTVAKNPCMHAGDLRVMNAVDRAELRHMVDCIVFPAVGPRPITNMCSGSDLDGDLYHVIWEPMLIPDTMHEPLDYSSGKVKEKDTDITIDDVIQFFVQFVEIDQLGRLANAHLALSDSKPMGIKDPVCVELAKAFSQAVDFPKTGFMPSMPNGVKDIIYPDFMQKPSKGYESQKIIGKLYRKARSVSVSTDEGDLRDNIEMSKCFIVDGYQAYLQEATELYLAYRHEIERLMVYFECRKESELFMSLSLFRSDSHRKNEGNELNTIAINNLWDFYREIFFKPFNVTNKGLLFENREAQKKASAWYYACYSHPLNKRLRIISFPWIVEDMLQRLPKINIVDTFSQSVLLKYNQYRDDKQLISLFIENLILKDDISGMVGSELMLSGLFGLFLFGDENETNLDFLLCEPGEQSVEELKERLDDFLDNVFVFNNKVKCQLDDNISFTISSSKSSLMRFLYIRNAILCNALLLPFLYVISHFARLDGIFTFLSQEKITFDLFLEFCLSFCSDNGIFAINFGADEIERELGLLKGDRERIDCQQRWNELQDQLYEYANFNFHDSVGHNVLSFFREMAFSSNKYSFKSKFDETAIELSSKSSELLSIHFLKAFNLLSQASRIHEVWHAISEKPESVFKKSFKMIKKKGKSKSVFAENASLLLVSNYETDFDVVDFGVYNGKRRSLHLNKQCYSISNISQRTSGFSKSCENDFKMHALRQLFKAKETQSKYNFAFQLKFGDTYFTNLPSVLLEETSSIQLYKLREALKRGYKTYNFCFHKDREESDASSKADEGSEATDNDEDDIGGYGETSNERDDKSPDRKKMKKKKKVKIHNANTSFDSNINTEPGVLHNLFQKNEFESKVSDAYIVYLELLSINENRISAFRVKYSIDFELISIETLPIKWLCVDVCNMSSSGKKRDMRFSLLAARDIDLSRDKFASSGSSAINRTALNEKIKEGVVRKVGDDYQENYIAVSEDFRNCDNVFVRHTKSIKYIGGYENWKPIFDMAGVSIESSLAEKWLNKIQVSVHETDEFSDNNEQGVFQVLSKRNELVVTLKHDINSLNISESNEVINVMWSLSKLFALLLE